MQEENVNFDENNKESYITVYNDIVQKINSLLLENFDNSNVDEKLQVILHINTLINQNFVTNFVSKCGKVDSEKDQ